MSSLVVAPARIDAVGGHQLDAQVGAAAGRFRQPEVQIADLVGPQIPLGGAVGTPLREAGARGHGADGDHAARRQRAVGVDGDIEGELIAGHGLEASRCRQHDLGLGFGGSYVERRRDGHCGVLGLGHWDRLRLARLARARSIARHRQLDRALPQQQQDQRGRHQRHQQRRNQESPAGSGTSPLRDESGHHRRFETWPDRSVDLGFLRLGSEAFRHGGRRRLGKRRRLGWSFNRQPLIQAGRPDEDVGRTEHETLLRITTTREAGTVEIRQF